MLGDVEEEGFNGTRPGFQVLKVMRSSSSSSGSHTHQLHLRVLFMVHAYRSIVAPSEMSGTPPTDDYAVNTVFSGKAVSFVLRALLLLRCTLR